MYKTTLCGGFQLILNKFFSCHQVIALSCHIFLHHTLILCTLLHSHIVIQILWCSVKIFVFTFVHPFLYQIMKYGSHILCEHIMYTCRHGFKNRTRPAGPTSWTVGWSQFRFGPVTRLDGDQIGIGPLEPVNRTNRPVLREPAGSMNLIFFF